MERSVLNTQPIRTLVDKNNVATLIADWSEEDPEVTRLLEALGSKQLPVVAIFPAGNRYRPQRLTGFYTKGSLLRNLKTAGPSQGNQLAAQSSGSDRG